MKGVQLAFGRNGFARLTLSNAAKHNALSGEVIGRLREAVAEVRERKDQVRALFVRSEGKSFCAGADLGWMKAAATYGREENIQDALELSGMLYDIASLPVPTVAMVQGAALGGGVGIVSVCDIAVGVASAKFTLSEVKLGLIPATISPYVIRRIGANQSRRYFLSAERFDAAKAQSIGLLHEVVADQQELDAFEEHLMQHFSRNGPSAMAASKSLIDSVEGRSLEQTLLHDTAVRLAEQRETAECKEGIQAFFEKREPSFILKK